MKFGITGHTSGIGKAIKEYLEGRGHTVKGFSRTNGYNISLPDVRKKIVEECQDMDGFFNNAYVFHDESQLDLLKEMYATWQGKKKIIVNVGSRSSDFVDVADYPQPIYAKEKKKLDDFCSTLVQGPLVINLRPGSIDTPLTKSMNRPKMNVEAVTKILQFAFDNLDSFKIRSITFTP